MSSEKSNLDPQGHLPDRLMEAEGSPLCKKCGTHWPCDILNALAKEYLEREHKHA